MSRSSLVVLFAILALCCIAVGTVLSSVDYEKRIENHGSSNYFSTTTPMYNQSFYNALLTDDLKKTRPVHQTSPLTPSEPGCKCLSKTFDERFEEADDVVVVNLVDFSQSCKYCFERHGSWNPLDEMYKINMFTFQVATKWKGRLRIGAHINAQSFNAHPVCGVKIFHKTRYYLLLLDDPSKNRMPSIWFYPKEWYVMDACQKHARWDAVPGRRKEWLSSQ